MLPPAVLYIIAQMFGYIKSNFRIAYSETLCYNFNIQCERGAVMSVVTFYRGHPNPPKTTQGAHLGANAIITYKGKLLLEKRRDSDVWGLVGGGVKKTETELQAIVREVREELGLRIPAEKFRKLAVYGEPGRIAAYRDGSIWRMVIVVFAVELEDEPVLQISHESRDLRFFSKEELQNIEVVITHSDIVEDWFVNQ